MAGTSHSNFTPWSPPDQAVHTSTEALQASVEAAGCALIGLGRDGRICHWNAEANRLFGHPVELALGSELPTHCDASERDAIARSVRLALSGRPTADGAIVVRGQDGNQRHVVWNVRPVRNPRGEIAGATFCGFETADRQWHNAPHSDQRDRASGMPASARLDAEGRFVDVSAAYAGILGYAPEELIGQHWDHTLHPHDQSAFRQAERVMMATGQAELEARGLRKNGTHFLQIALLLRGPSNQGGVDGYFCLIRDITEVRRESALKLAHNRVLDLLTQDVPLNDILSDLVLALEEQIDGIACTVLLFDPTRQTLRLGVGPGLPTSYLESIDGMTVGPQANPCGLAAHSNDEVIVEDVLTDPRCAEVVDIVRRHGLRSCRAMPIRAENGQVLGVFSLYRTGDDWPSKSDMFWIKAAVSLAGMVIERQQTRDKLRANEAVFQALAATVRAIPWEMDLANEEFTYVGVQAEKILGYRRDSPGWYSARFWNDAIHEDDRDYVDKTFREAMQREDDFACDYRMKTTTGQYRWFHNVVHVDRADGRPSKLRGLMIDITARKRAEKEAEKTNQLLAALTRAQSQFISEVDSRILFEELQLDLLTLTDSEYGFIGEVLHDADGEPYLKTQAITNIAWDNATRAFYDENAPQGMEFSNLETLFGRVIATGETVISNAPTTDPRGNGTPSGHPPLDSFLGIPFLRGNQLVGMIGMANRPGGYNQELVASLEPVLAACGAIIEAYRNDQRRKLAEAALAEAHENLEQRVGQRTRELTAANMQLRFQAQLLDSVQEAVFATDLDGRVNYWGRGAEQTYGYHADQVMGHPITRMAADATHDAHSRALAQARDSGSWSGEHRQRRKDGSSFWADSIISLVTDPLGAPTGFIHIGRDVSERRIAEEKVQQRQNELAHVSRLSTMGEMTTGLAHEINQPLHAIANYAEGSLLRMQNQRLETHDLHDALTQISRSAQQAGEIIRRLRRFVGKCALHRSSVDVNELIREALKMIDFEAKRLGITIRLHLTDPLPLLLADSVQIEQVILNLLRNSFQAMEANPPATRVVFIETSRTTNGAIRVAVRDAGHGFQDVDLDRIFEAFFTTKEEGLGMGLAISRSIIEAHDGRLWATRNSDQGATFLFTLPVTQQEARNVHG